MINEQRSDNHSYLDSVRMNDGIEPCKAAFYNAYKENREKAAALLNDQQLTFPCLFILLPQIESLQLSSALNFRNTAALGIVHQILRPKESGHRHRYLASPQKEVQPVLQWMLETGGNEDRLEDDYREVLDIVASVLINEYKDTSILPMVTDMIFRRHQKGQNIHTLVWAVFRIRDPYALKLIAEHIRSSDRQEATLACHLLNIEAPDTSPSAAECQKRYGDYLHWLEENDGFLYFTDESFQFASEPAICKVDLERKYIHQVNSSYTVQPVTPSDSMEETCLQAFAPLSHAEKTVLSDYSYKMHNTDVSEWKNWVSSPIDEQLKTAKTRAGGSR